MIQESDSIVLRPKKMTALGLLAGSVIFVAGGLLMAQEHGWIGYFCAGFFALGIPVALVQLLPGSTYLRIAEDGISFANLFRVTRIPWDVIDHFSVFSLKNTGITVQKWSESSLRPAMHRRSASGPS